MSSSRSNLPLPDREHRFVHDDGYYYQYPQTPEDVERYRKVRDGGSKFKGPGYERRKKQRADDRDEAYDPENDPEVIKRRRAQKEKKDEAKRKAIAE